MEYKNLSFENGKELEYSKDLVVVINSIAAFAMFYSIKIVFAFVYLFLLGEADYSIEEVGVCVLFGLIVVAVVIGLFARKNSAKYAVLFLCFPALFMFPIGTLCSTVMVACLLKNNRYYK